MKDNGIGFLVIASFVLFLGVYHVRAEAPSDGKSRPGNDDIFIYYDSSLSMLNEAAEKTSYLEVTRKAIKQIIDCYVKPGDFVLIGSCDSECHIHTASRIQSEKDIVLLQQQVDALDIAREKYFEKLHDSRREIRRPANLRQPNILVGGGQYTDLGAMLDSVRTVLETFSSPDKRQLVLIFTDGKHDPPPYSPYAKYTSNQLPFDKFLPIQTVQGKRIGVVAIPKQDGKVDRALQDFLRNLDPQGTITETIPVADVTKNIMDLLNARLDLEAPDRIVLTPAYSPELRQDFAITNKTRVDRVVNIKDAVFVPQDGSGSVSLEVKVSKPLKIPSQQSIGFAVAGSLNDLPPGHFEGKIKFKVDDAVKFYPNEIAVAGNKLTWVEAYWWVLAIILCAALLGVAGAGLYWRRVFWITFLWRDQKSGFADKSPVKKIRIGETLDFGGVGSGVPLNVAGPEPGVKIGGVLRNMKNDFYFKLYADKAEHSAPGQEPSEPMELPMVSGNWRSAHQAGYEECSFCFVFSWRKRDVDMMAKALVERATPKVSDSGKAEDDLFA